MLADLAQYRNELVKLNTLPPEIIMRIMGMSARTAAEEGKDMLWTLAQVCRDWRDNVLNHSELWASGVSSHFTEKRVSWALKKSGRRNLNVFIEDGALEDHHARLEQALPHAQRWASLSLSVNDASDILQTFPVLHFPVLRHLHLTLYGLHRLAVPAEVPDAPNLISLHCERVTLRWERMAYSQLRFLHLEDIRRTNAPTVVQILQIAESAPQLEELYLNRVMCPTSPDGKDRAFNEPPEWNGHRYYNTPNLKAIRLLRLERQVASWILCSLRPNAGYGSVQVDSLPTSVLSTHLSHLRFCLSEAISYEKGINVVFASIITMTSEGLRDFPDGMATRARGLNINFQVFDPQDFEAVQNYLGPMNVPVDVIVKPYIEDPFVFRLDLLSSLRHLEIHNGVNPLPILEPLGNPSGPRKALRWPCMSLRTICIGKHNIHRVPRELPDAPLLDLHPFLRRRYGPAPPLPPEEFDFEVDPSRPPRLESFMAPSNVIGHLQRTYSVSHAVQRWIEFPSPVRRVEPNLLPLPAQEPASET